MDEINIISTAVTKDDGHNVNQRDVDLSFYTEKMLCLASGRVLQLEQEVSSIISFKLSGLI
jgi:hypothetical protein